MSLPTAKPDTSLVHLVPACSDADGTQFDTGASRFEMIYCRTGARFCRLWERDPDGRWRPKSVWLVHGHPVGEAAKANR